MSIVARIKQALPKSRRERRGVYVGKNNNEFISHSKVEQWKEYEFKYPSDHPAEGHTKVWTGAPGVWYCRTCSEWYRIWEETPRYANGQRKYSSD